MMNDIGPSTYPCGTPLVINFLSEKHHCSLPLVTKPILLPVCKHAFDPLGPNFLLQPTIMIKTMCKIHAYHVY